MPSAHLFRPAPWHQLTVCALLLALISGCASAPNSSPGTDEPQALTHPPARISIAPVDVTLAELTAGGSIQVRADWTESVREQITRNVAARTGFQPHQEIAAGSPEMSAEAADVQPLLRAMAMNRLMANSPTPAANSVPPEALTREFDYDVGPLLAHTEMQGDGAVLFIFGRNSYATSGRKAILALSLVGAAFTGVYVAPSMGSSLAAAALVDHDGRVIWMNEMSVNYDLRTPAGLERFLEQLLHDLPPAITAVPAT